VQPSEFGVVEGVVDGDEPPPGCGEERRRNGGPVAAGAMDPDLSVGHLVDPFRQLVEGKVEGALDAGGRELCGTADVEHRNSTVVPDVIKVGEGGAGEGVQRLGGPLPGSTNRRRSGPVDADSHQLTLRCGNVVRCLTEQGDGLPHSMSQPR